MTPPTFTHQLELRRQQLGLTHADIAKRSGVGYRTVQRILAGQDANPSFATLSAIAAVVGCSFSLTAEDPDLMRHRQATHKAKKLLAIVQGTSALESQAVDDQAMRSMLTRTVNDLLAGSPRRLWAE